MTMELICCEIMETGRLKFLDSTRNEARAPKVRLKRPLMAMAPPTMAITTYWMLPMLFIMGPRILE